MECLTGICRTRRVWPMVFLLTGLHSIATMPYDQSRGGGNPTIHPPPNRVLSMVGPAMVQGIGFWKRPGLYACRISLWVIPCLQRQRQVGYFRAYDLNWM